MNIPELQYKLTKERKNQMKERIKKLVELFNFAPCFMALKTIEPKLEKITLKGNFVIFTIAGKDYKEKGIGMND